MSTSSDVRVGQLWLDLDQRERNRTLRVTHVGTKYARCDVYRNGQLSPRYTAIRLDRFKPVGKRGGYELLADASVGEPIPATAEDPK